MTGQGGYLVECNTHSGVCPMVIDTGQWIHHRHCPHLLRGLVGLPMWLLGKCQGTCLIIALALTPPARGGRPSCTRSHSPPPPSPLVTTFNTTYGAITFVHVPRPGMEAGSSWGSVSCSGT